MILQLVVGRQAQEEASITINHKVVAYLRSKQLTETFEKQFISVAYFPFTSPTDPEIHGGGFFMYCG